MLNTAAQSGQKSHNPVFYHLIMPPLRLYLYLRYGYRRPKDVPAFPKDKAFVVLGSHASNLDFLFTLVAIYPHRPNVLITEFFFGNKLLAALLRFLRAIPRKQFRADAASVRAMMSVTRRGGCLLLYPEGEVNGTGRFCRMPPGAGRMCKMMGVPVYTAVTEGSYLSLPKWAAAQRRGKVFCRLTLAADEKTLKESSAEELESIFKEKLYYDDFAWQNEKRIAFRTKAPAEKLERILYRCPRCGAEARMKSEGARFLCTACGNAAYMDEYGFLHARGAEDKIFSTVADWSQYQRECLRREAAAHDYRLEAEGTLLLHMKSGKMLGEEAGRGVICLDKEALSYQGERLGEQVSLRWPLDGFFKLPFGAGRDFDIPSGDEPRVSFRPDERQLVEKFVLAVDTLYDLRQA